MSSGNIQDLHEWSDVAETNVLVLNYTMTCPLSCSFCCYGCHPKRTEKMPLSEARRLISEAAELGSFSSVGFTGGEVFAYEEDLLALADHLFDVNMAFTVATAAHWGESASHARTLAKRLVSRGLRRANISCDEAHSEFVSPLAVTNAAKAFADEGIPVYIVGTFVDENGQLDKLLPELVDQQYIRLVTKKIARVGRAKKSLSPLRATNNYFGTCYRRIYHDIVVFWDGRTYPCCSTFNRATRGISIGNAFEESLETLLKRADRSSLFRILKRRGFGEFYEAAERYNPAFHAKLPPLSSCEGPCSLCNTIFSQVGAIDNANAIADELIVDEMIEASCNVN